MVRQILSSDKIRLGGFENGGREGRRERKRGQTFLNHARSFHPLLPKFYLSRFRAISLSFLRKLVGGKKGEGLVIKDGGWFKIFGRRIQLY